VKDHLCRALLFGDALRIRNGSAGHFIAIAAQDGDTFIVGDPLRGREVMSLEALKKRYDFTGFHMRIKQRTSQ